MKRFENDEGYIKLKEALRRTNRDFLEEAALVPESEEVFACGYDERLMKRIKARKKNRPVFANTVLRRAALFLFVILFIGACSLSVEAVRIPVFNFVETVYGKFTSFVMGDEFKGPDTIESVYTLATLPEGFEKIAVYTSATDVTTKWGDGATFIELEQRTSGAEALHRTYNSENLRLQSGGVEYVYIGNFGLTSLLWHNGEYFFVIHWYDTVSVYEMIDLAESITVYN